MRDGLDIECGPPTPIPLPLLFYVSVTLPMTLLFSLLIKLGMFLWVLFIQHLKSIDFNHEREKREDSVRRWSSPSVIWQIEEKIRTGSPSVCPVYFSHSILWMSSSVLFWQVLPVKNPFFFAICFSKSSIRLSMWFSCCCGRKSGLICCLSN